MKINPVTIYALSFSMFLFATMLAFTPTTHAEFSCNFERNLDIGIEGDDVLCLQKFLNEAGYTLAESGAGSPGAETKRFGALTREALARWQVDNGVNPASGYLGALTRAALLMTPTKTLETETSTTPELGTLEGVLSSLSGTDRTQANELLALLDALGITGSGEGKSTQTKTQTQTQTTSSVSTQTKLNDLMLSAVRMIRDAEDAIDDNDVSAEELTKARNNYEDARDDLVDAVYAYFTNDTEDALEYADDAYDNAKDALEDAGGATQEDELDERISDLEDDIDNAWDDLEDADDNGDDTSDAEEYLTDAENVLDQAKDSYDDGEFADTEDYLDEVEDLIDDALDAIVTEDEQDAQDAIDDAQDAIDDAFDDIRDARNDGDDVDTAQDYLDKAEALLEDAEDAFDDETYEDAIDYANDAEDYAGKAIDQL